MTSDLFQCQFTTLLQVPSLPHVLLSDYQPFPEPQINWGFINFKFENINSSFTMSTASSNYSKYSMGSYLRMSGRIHLSQMWLKSLPRLIITMSLKSNCNTCDCLLNQYLMVCFRSLLCQVPWCLPQTLGRSLLHSYNSVPREQSQQDVKVSEKSSSIHQKNHIVTYSLRQLVVTQQCCLCESRD